MISATVIFAAKVSSTSTNLQSGWVASNIALSAADLKSLGIYKLKTRVIVRFNHNSDEDNSTIACFQAVTAKKANDKHGVVCLHKMWQPMFNTTLDDAITSPSSTHGHENRRIEISRVPSRTQFLDCRDVLVSIQGDHLPEMVFTSSYFYSYLKLVVEDIPLSPKLKFGLSYKGSTFVLKIICLTAMNESIEYFEAKEDTFFVLTDHTNISCFRSGDASHEEAQIKKFRNTYCTIDESSRKRDLVSSFNSIDVGGYEEQKKIALGALCVGIGRFQFPLSQQDASTTATTSIYGNSSASTVTALQSFLHPPKGMILYGPAGVGKSRLMRSLVKAAGCNYIELSTDILLSKLEGDAERAIQRVFEYARRNSPCCILIDNLEVLGHVRSGAFATDLQKRVVSCLLTLIDGIDVASDTARLQERIFFIGTTAKLTDVDPAIRRSGRLEKVIEMNVPSAVEREQILRVLLRDMAIVIVTGREEFGCHPAGGVDGDSAESDSPSVTVDNSTVVEAAKLAHGMVGSDLMRLIKEAVHNMLQRTELSKETSIFGQQGCSEAERDESLSATLSDQFQSMSLSTPLKVTENSSSVECDKEEDNNVNAIGNRLHLHSDDFHRALSRVSPSALREVVVEIPSVHWTDIGGMDAVKQSLKEVVEWPLKHPEMFRNLGISPLRGVLLYGPPGCSKTLMAKALATESQMNFLAVRGPELLSKWLGESEKAIQSLFRRARAAAPTIIFFDEIDALAGKRGDTSSGVSDRVLSQLLTELDGIQGLKQVIVIAATNRPDLLDAALIRPGRIDRKIYVPPPDDGSREQIFRLELRKVPLSSDVDFSILTLLSAGFSGAEITAVCTEAAMLAIEKDIYTDGSSSSSSSSNNSSNSDSSICSSSSSSSGGSNANEDRAKLCVGMQELREAIASTKPQITMDMLAFYADLVKRL